MGRLVRTKVIECGSEYRDVEMYLAPSDVRRRRGPRTGIESTAAKTERNNREAKKTFVRISKANFAGGRYITLTFAKQYRPDTTEEAHKLARDFFEGVYDRCARRDIHVRVVYVVEVGRRGGLHVHALVNEAVPIGQLQRWRWGITCIRSVPANTEDIEKIAGYMVKSPLGKGRHRWYKIGTLSEPVVTADDKQVTPSEFWAMFLDGFREGDVMELVARLFPGHRIVYWEGYFCGQMESPYLSVSLERRPKQQKVHNIIAVPHVDDSTENIGGYTSAFLRLMDPDQREVLLQETV